MATDFIHEAVRKQKLLSFISNSYPSNLHLASGSILAMTFYLPTEFLDEEDKPMQEIAEKGAREAGNPMISFFTPAEILTLADKAGFKDAKTISVKDMEQYYFQNRTDNLLPASGEVFLVAAT